MNFLYRATQMLCKVTESGSSSSDEEDSSGESEGESRRDDLTLSLIDLSPQFASLELIL